MNGIVINIDPVALQLGGFELRWYSIAVIVAIAAAVLIGVHEGKRKGIPSREIYSLALWAVIGGVVGAKLFHVVDYWEHYLSNPAHILHPQGLAIWGGLAGGGIVAILFARVRHLPLGPLADAAVPALLTAQIIGRFGCIVNGDAYGGATNLPWGFIYVHPDAVIPGNLFGVPTHPYPVYEMLWNSTILLVLLRVRRYFRRDGSLFLSYLGLYSVARFVLTFVRQENQIFLGLQEAQIVALAGLVASVAILLYLYRYSPKKLAPETVAEVR